jgi:hypothetical protein
MSTATIISVNRKRLLRELLALGELAQVPGIRYDKELRREVRKERELIISELRPLPLAG